MAAISTRFGSGGANLAPGGSAGSPSLAEALRDIADDLAAMVAAVGEGSVGAALTDPIGAALTDSIGAALSDAVGAALPDFTDPPSAGEMAALKALVNQLRTAVLSLQSRVNEIRTAELTDQARVNQIRTAVLTAQERVNEMRLVTAGEVTLLTTKV